MEPVSRRRTRAIGRGQRHGGSVLALSARCTVTSRGSRAQRPGQAIESWPTRVQLFALLATFGAQFQVREAPSASMSALVVRNPPWMVTKTPSWSVLVHTDGSAFSPVTQLL